MKVGVWSYYSVDRLPVKFHRIWSLFDAPTDNYSGNIAGLTSDVFGLRKQMPAPLSLFSPLSLATAHLGHPPSPLRFWSCPMRPHGPKPSLHSASNPSRERPKAVPDPTRTVVTAVSGSSQNIYKISSFYLLDSLAYLFSSVVFRSDDPDPSLFTYMLYI